MFYEPQEARRHSSASASVLLDEDHAAQIQGVLRMLQGSWEGFAQELAASERHALATPKAGAD